MNIRVWLILILLLYGIMMDEDSKNKKKKEMNTWCIEQLIDIGLQQNI